MANGYTQEGIMAQILVAFGQGTGTIRVSHDAAVTLRSLYLEKITADILLNQWKTKGVQALERVRALGRLAAFKAMERGDTAVSADDVSSAAVTVHAQSDTEFCPPKL